MLTAIAGRTDRVRLGTTVTALPRRRPAKLAREVLTLDHLSAGRATVAEKVALRPPPVQSPRVPVWVGGSTQAGAVRRRAARADGIVPYKLTDTDGWADFTPDEVRDLVAAMPPTRADGQPFDVAIGGRRRRPDERAERAYLRELAAAGATWWLEYVPVGDPAAMRAAVARGPLR
ncbi:LLM class flavin-dependent oxidoreductase [Micromonospora sp. NBC_00617]|uniref:LLM class flavin-dependent oxidoreductase n=1 Tax=Micromonospora sp. NBC_00617 TaxID=2903587 RepID=UPI0030E3BF00